jgi:pyruvate formate lyase activating enzyme
MSDRNVMIPLYKKENHKIVCLLCPHYCKLIAGQTGICGVRKNTGKKIELLTYGVISGYSLDPIEKKPLYHFFPGNTILSIGSYGCNLRCDFCQNFSISQNVPEILKPEFTPEKLVSDALSAKNNIGIAFTYNEPVIWFEFMRDVAISIKKEGLYTVMVSNGYVTSEPLSEIITFIDAFNIDLKAFDNSFYKRLTGSEIQPVKDALKQIVTADRHLEITTLIIPGQNDNDEDMARQSEWIAGELGKGVPLHLSRYFPMYKRDEPATTQDTLKRLYDIASRNLDHVYLGNSFSEAGQNTFCPECGKILTIRAGYNTRLFNLDREGKCINCGNPVYRYFTFSGRTKR